MSGDNQEVTALSGALPRSEAVDDSRLDQPTLHERFADRPNGLLRPEVDITLAEPEDVDQLAKVVAVAFHDLSASRFLIPDEDDRRKIYPGFFKLVYVEPGVHEGIVHRTADSLACAVWLPMGDPLPEPGPAAVVDAIVTETIDESMEAELEALTGPYYPNFVRFDELLNEAHAPYLAIPHDFLGVVAAHPVVQGQGNLRALMAARLPELDREGRDSYLEAAEPYLVPVYEKFGYQLTGQTIHLPTCDLFPMWRKARG
jgi:GNAT superfamily N-acetyltransferase